MLSMWLFLQSKRDKLQAFKITLLRWRYFEFWPWWLFYIPVFMSILDLISEGNGTILKSRHIRTPLYSLTKAYQSLFHQWYVAFDIGALNEENGTQR